MLNTKLNLYNAEWLDVVFEDRNKAYGAYDLRKHYAATMVKAILIMIAFIVAGWVAIKLTTISVPADNPVHTTVVDIHPPIIKPPVDEPKPNEPKPEPVKQQPQAATTRFVPPVVVDKPERDEAPIIDEIEGPIAQQTTEGVKGPENVVKTEPASSGTGTVPAKSNDPVSTFGLEVQPEPFGGMAAFSKFLSKNLRYPSAASEQGIGGKVIVSFVIERDGSLSNIVVETGPGYGMDQEAVRVLKLAKAWKPGIQNGQPVRVRYMIPIAFQLPEN
jgi:protein TonB